MHAAPRFGHTNRIGQIVSANSEDAVDYASGVSALLDFFPVARSA